VKLGNTQGKRRRRYLFEAALRVLVQIPRLGLEHIADAVRAHGHHHFGAGLEVPAARAQRLVGAVIRVQTLRLAAKNDS